MKDDDKMGGFIERAGEGQGLAMQRYGTRGWLGSVGTQANKGH